MSLVNNDLGGVGQFWRDEIMVVTVSHKLPQIKRDYAILNFFIGMSYEVNIHAQGKQGMQSSQVYRAYAYTHWLALYD